MTGANPFVLSYEKLKPYVLTVRDYLIKCQTIAMFASIRDIKNKEVWQLRKLRAMGVNGLSIGVESGDDETLLLANKGYTSQDILEQCQKLDEAGIEYYFVYMTGLAGAGKGYQNAISSAYLPKEREKVLDELQQVMNTFTEEEMQEYRKSLKALG